MVNIEFFYDFTPKPWMLTINMILLLPFSYFSAVIIRRNGYHSNGRNSPEVFCNLTFMAKFIFQFIGEFFIKDHIKRGTFMPLLETFLDIYLLGIIQYFLRLNSILQQFKIYGYKIINGFLKFLKYFFIGLFALKIILAYLGKSTKMSVIILDIFLYILCFFMMSLCFIFTDIKEFIPTSIIKSVKIVLFFYPLTIFIAAVFVEISESFLVRRHKFLVYYLNLFKDLFVFYVLLAFVVILSGQGYKEEENEPSDPADIISMALVDESA